MTGVDCAVRATDIDAQALTRKAGHCRIICGTQQALAASHKNGLARNLANRRNSMKLEWHKPEVVEEEVGLEVTSYAPAELDRA